VGGGVGGGVRGGRGGDAPCTCAPNEELEGTLHPQKFGCTPKNEGKRVHVPQMKKPVGILII
jgi:hypothetical protein